MSCELIDSVVGLFLAIRPRSVCVRRSDFTASDEDMDDVTEVFGGSLVVPDNFEKTAPTLAEWHRNLPSESVSVCCVNCTGFCRGAANAAS